MNETSSADRACGIGLKILRRGCVAALLVGALIAWRDARAAGNVPSLETNLPAHPRLLANAERWEALRRQIKTDPTSAKLAEAVLLRAEQMLVLPPIRYEKEGRRLLRPVRESVSRILALGMAARLGDDARFRERAIEEMRAAAALPDWNPSHFLDTAEMTFGLAIGYDWLFEWLATEDRERIADAMVEKGLKASFPSDGSEPGWAEARNNWTQVCNSGLVAGAIAVAPRESELGRKVLERAFASLPGAAELAYAPDGAYPEGPSYWAYGTIYHAILADVLEHAFGSTFGLDAFPGFLESAQYVNQMTTPRGEFYNYGDNTERRAFGPAMFWFARKMRDRAIVARDLAAIEPMLQRLRAGNEEQSLRFAPLALLWWDPSLNSSASESKTTAPLSWMGRGLMPVVVHRTGWDDRDAGFVGIKGGAIQASHAHMDIGSFIVELGGVRWAVDLGPEDYHPLEQRGLNLWSYHEGADRWSVFRLGSEGHNILRFDGADQAVRANAPIVGLGDAPGNRYTTIDLSSAYRPFVDRARRTLRLEDAARVTIEDAWLTSDKATEVAWQWLTRAEVEVTREGATLRQEGRMLRLRVVEPAADWTLAVEETSRLMRAHDTPEPELRRIVLHTKTAAHAEGSIVVVAELVGRE